MAEPVYVQAGANVEATDTFATWINTTNALVYDMGTKVLTTTTFTQPNTSVGGYVTGNSQIEGIFSANTLTATTALRGGTVSTSGNLNITSNAIFSDSNLVHVTANTDNFNINANNMYITSGITANTTKSVTISAANTNINSGGLFVKTDASFTGGRVDIDSPVLDVTSNTVITASTLNANVDIITLGFNGSDALNVNAVADFNANVNIDGILTSTANALFTGAQAQFDNNVIIGSSVADSLTVNAYLVSDLLPTANTVDLGSASKQYGNVHTMYVYAGADVEAIGEVVLKGTAAKTVRVTGSNGAYQNLNITFSNNSVSNTAIVANTSGLFGGVNQLYSLGSSSVNWKDLYVQNSFVTANEVITGDLAVNGGDITTSATTFNLVDANATTVNAFGAATTIDIGANSGTITINNPTLVGTQTTQNVYNTTATTVNAFGAATALNLGAATGTATFNNATLAFNGGTVSTNKTTFTLLNTTATTVNAFGAATAIALGAATGNTTINNNAVITGDVAVNGGDLTTSATTFNLVNGTATTLNVGGAATTLNIGNASGVQTITVGGSTTANSTYNIATGATASGMTKTVNVGTSSNTGSTTNVNIGSANGGVTTINSGTLSGSLTTQNVFNSTATTVNAFGAATALNVGASTGTLTIASNTVVGTAVTQDVFNTTATTINAFGAATTLNLGQANATVNLGKTNGNTSVVIAGNGLGGTATLDTNVTTGKFRIAPEITTGTVEVGSDDSLGSNKILFTTNSDTIFTGALVVAGGVGVAKTIRVGNNAIVDGDLTVKGAVDFQGDVNVNLSEANTATLKVTSSAQFTGTIGSSMIPGTTSTYNIGSTGSRWLNVWADSMTVTNSIAANNVSASTSLITGAFTVKSGNKDAIILDANINGSENRTITVRTPSAGLSANAIVTFANGNTTFQVGTMAITGGTLAQFAATTSSQLAGVISDETGTGSLVFSNSPTLVTPTLGVATATSINKVAITAPATSATLTIADGKTATINNTLTFNGTDGSTVALGAGGTVVYTSNKLSALSSTTSAELAGVISDETGSGVLVFGTAPTFTTNVDSSATFTAFASATALTVGSTGTASSTTNLSTGVAASGTTKTINIGTGGAAGSTTNINFGASSGTGTATFNNDLVVTGNLIVNGTTSTINSTTISVDDKNIELGSVASPTNTTADGGGITLKGTTDKTFNWVNATGAWTSSEDIDLAPGKAYKVNGVSVLSSTSLASSIVNSSLTSVGTLTSGTWNATTIGTAYGGTGLTTFTSGGAVYATSTSALTTGTLPAASGGTGQSSYAVGDLLYASTTTALSKLADVATGNALISGGVGVAPAWGKIGLTTHISGTLAIGNGGTGQTTQTAAFDALSPLTTLGDTLYDNGTNNVRLAGNTTTTKQFLSQTGNGTVSAAPSWSTVTKADVGLSAVENTALSTWPGTANVVTVGTVTTGTWNAGVISSTYGGTGVNNSARTITVGGNLVTANTFTTSGNFALTLTTTAATNVTLPTTGTLATLAGSESFSNKTITGGSINNTPIGATTASTGKFSTLDISSVADTATAATHYYVETATDGFIRPKTLANVQTEVVTATAVGNHAPTKTGTGASGTWGISITGNAATATNANSVNNGVYTTGDQSISGIKTFANTISGSITGNAATVTNGVYTTGDQTIGGIKAFNGASTIFNGSNGTYTGVVFIGGRHLRLANATNNLEFVNAANSLVTLIHTDAGDLTVNGNVTAYSDKRLKSNIRTIDNALDKVTAMRGVYFDKDGKAGLGVIAQEVEQVLPEAVLDGEYKSVAYGNIVGVLIEAIKELKAEIEELKKGK